AEVFQLVRDPDALDLEPHVPQNAAHQEATQAEHAGHRTKPASVPLANHGGSLIVHEPASHRSPQLRSSTRNLALRGGGLSPLSSSTGGFGFGVGSRNPDSAAKRRNPRLTRRSSSEWNA